MIKKWIPTILAVIAIAGILTFALQQIFVKTTLSEQEIINRVESLYNGSVVDITKNKRHYNVVFSDDTKVYEVQVDEEQGTFHHLTLLANRGETISVHNEADGNTAPEQDSTSSNNDGTQTDQSATKAVRISEAEAEQIALTQINGVIDDIEFYASADGGYYIVEVETAEQDAGFQIHAITGKILSVVYDD